MIGNQLVLLESFQGKIKGCLKILNEKEEVIVNKHSIKLIKGNGGLTPLITADYLDQIFVAELQQKIV